MTSEAKVELLYRALGLEATSFLDYLARTAPPVDIDRYPEVAAALDRMVAEEEAIADDLLAAIEAEGAPPRVDAEPDMQFPYYNYVTCEYALKVMVEQLEARLARFDALVDQAAADVALHGFLRGLRDRQAAMIARVRELHAAVAGAGKKKDALSPSLPPKGGGGKDAAGSGGKDPSAAAAESTKAAH
jgi:hypothetical protein